MSTPATLPTSDPRTTPSTEQIVRSLLAAAGLTVGDDEFAVMVADYPQHRQDLDALYEVPMAHEEEPQLIFTPLV